MIPVAHHLCSQLTDELIWAAWGAPARFTEQAGVGFHRGLGLVDRLEDFAGYQQDQCG